MIPLNLLTFKPLNLSTRTIKTAFLFFAVILALSGCSKVQRPFEYARTDTLMNTFIQMKVFSFTISTDELEKAVEETVELGRMLEGRFSVFVPGSEVNALNMAGKSNVSPVLFDLIVKSRDIGEVTGGEFDITVAPALKKDGFYGDMPTGLLKRIPDTLDGIGWDKVSLVQNTQEVVLGNNTWIDLSGIAKGYIVDWISDHLRNRGIDAFMVNAGGDIYCGKKPGGGTWKIGIRQPGVEGISVFLSMADMAVATSGDYENVIMDSQTGQIISHIIDPSTDMPVKKLPSSVTVIAPSCTIADALATGMMAMGPEKALDLANRIEDVEIVVIGVPGDTAAIKYSSGAEKYIIKK